MIGTWVYNGTSSLQVTFPSISGHTYTLQDNFGNGPATVTATGSTSTLTLTVAVGPSTGQTVASYVFDTTANLVICCTVYQYGSTSSPADPATWTWDGTVATATLTTVSGDQYTVRANPADGGATVSGATATGAGTSETITGDLSLDGGWAAITDGMGLFIWLEDQELVDTENPSCIFAVKGSASFTTSDSFGGAPSVLEGLCIAFTTDPLSDPSAGWTRIDTLAGVHITSVEITRGRPDETQKTEVGRMTVQGVDSGGALDPTNQTNDFWDGVNSRTNIDPVRHIGWAINNPVTGDWSARYVGYIDTLTYTIDQSAKFATFEIACVDALDILSDAEVIPDQAGNTVPGESIGDCYYTGQQVDDRIRAVLADASTAFLASIWPPSLMRIFSGNVALQGSRYSARTPLISVIDEACDGEFPGIANRYVDRTGVFTFHGRYARFHPDDVAYNINFWKLGDVHAFAGDAATVVLNDPANPVQFTRGKANLVNAAYATPLGIKAADMAGQFVSDTASVTRYAPRSVSFENLITEQGDEVSPLDANAETKLYATFWVDNYKLPQNRPQALTVKGVAASAPAATATWAYLCGVDLTDVVTLTTTHPGGGGFAGVEFFVEQLKETYLPLQGDQYDVTNTIEVSPRAYFDINPFTGDTHTT